VLGVRGVRVQERGQGPGSRDEGAGCRVQDPLESAKVVRVVCAVAVVSLSRRARYM